MIRITPQRRREIINGAALTLCTIAAAIGLFWLVFITIDVVGRGARSLSWDFFTNDPAPAGVTGGGLRHALVGQLMITLGAIAIGVPIGILGGTFLAEYGRRSRTAKLVSMLADVMAGVPSIVVGSVIFALMVRPQGHFSGWAGSLALGLMMVPVVLRTTEDMLKLIPWSLREAAFALGAPYYRVIIQVVYRAAASGIFTGVLLSIARIAGETAPLLFTSFNNSFLSTDMNGPVASLTVSIFQYAMGPYDDWHRQAWAASFVIMFAILLVTIAGRVVLARRGHK